jgi:hypothetical protein
MEYRSFENILVRMHGVRPDELGALRSRLRLLRDAGVPEVAKPGKGERVNYSYNDLWLANFALSLDKPGFPPLAVKQIVGAFTKSPGLLDKVKSGTRRPDINRAISPKPEPPDTWMVLNVMRWGKQDNTDPYLVDFRLGPLEEIVEHLRGEEAKKPGLPAVFQGLLNLSCLTRDCDQYFQT